MHKNSLVSIARRCLSHSETRLHLLLLLVSIIYLCSALALSPPSVNGSLSPSFFPIILGIAATTFCTIQILRDFKSLKNTAQELVSEAPETSAIGAIKTNSVVKLVLATGVYIALFVALGYLISSALYTYAVILIFSDNKQPIKKALIALTITAIGYIVFQELFNVRLPTMWE